MNPELLEHYTTLLVAAKAIGEAIYNGVHGLIASTVTNEELDQILAATAAKAQANASDARARAEKL